MFEHLPETFPELDKEKKPALFGSVTLHLLAVLLLLTIPLWAPYENVRPEFVTRLYLPPPPPPAAPAAAQAVETNRESKPLVNHHLDRAVDFKKHAEVQPPRPFVAPTAIPKDIAALADFEPVRPKGIVEGVPGGVYGGLPNGALGGIPGLSVAPRVAPPLPPPPPPPRPPAPEKKTYRVGGDVQEPHLLSYVAPRYPVFAKSRKIVGTVVLEATVTKSGNVADVRLISGNPTLADAAIEAVRQWRYEPTRLNGIPVSVILTAKVKFALAPMS